MIPEVGGHVWRGAGRDVDCKSNYRTGILLSDCQFFYHRQTLNIKHFA
jgi:hypothetical protein